MTPEDDELKSDVNWLWFYSMCLIVSSALRGCQIKSLETELKQLRQAVEQYQISGQPKAERKDSGE